MTRKGERGLVAGLLLLAAVAGCTVGSGSGTATGQLFILGCQKDGDPFGTADPENPMMVAPDDYDLRPTFFAGEPIEDTSSGIPQNRLIIRMQRDGRSIEVNDTLYFDIRNTYEVARCVRGRTIGGAPDWLSDERVTDFRGMPIENWCDWSGGGTTPRIRLHPDGLVRVSLVPLFTCPIPPVGAGTGGARVTGVAREGWIEFDVLGSANQSGIPSEMREELSVYYTVGFGADLKAHFSITDLADERVELAMRRLEPLPMYPRIGGTLTGEFDFTFERGRAAQTFP